jgi:hypothetical protein
VKVGTAVISKSIVVVVVLVADLIIPLAGDYILMTTWMTVIVDMGRTLTVVVLTEFKFISQQLFVYIMKKNENSQIFCQYLR